MSIGGTLRQAVLRLDAPALVVLLDGLEEQELAEVRQWYRRERTVDE